MTSPELDHLMKSVSWFAVISMQEYSIAYPNVDGVRQ